MPKIKTSNLNCHYWQFGAGQNGVPKTSSGKVQRSACAHAFFEGSLPIVRDWREAQCEVTEPENVGGGERSRQGIERFIAQQLAMSLAIPAEDIDLRQPFSSFGLDSLRTLQLLAQVEQWLGRDLLPTSFRNYPTISDFAAHLAKGSLETIAAETGQA